MTLKKTKILVLMLGQIRTLKYCYPYNKLAFKYLADFLNADITYAGVLKSFLTEVNVTGNEEAVNTELFRIPDSTTTFVSRNFEASTLDKVKHRTTYSKVIQTYLMGLNLIWNFDTEFDLIFVVRPDSLIGKRVDDLSRFEHGIHDVLSQPNSRMIYAHNGIFRLKREYDKIAMGDFFFYGNALSVKLLLSRLAFYFRTTTSDVYPKVDTVGPNVILYESTVKNELLVKPTTVDVVIVRTSSDLTQDVFTSFESHKKHFLDNHIGLTNGT